MPVSARKCGYEKVAAGLPGISQRKPNVRKHRTLLEREDSGTGSPDRRCRHGLLPSAVPLRLNGRSSTPSLLEYDPYSHSGGDQAVHPLRWRRCSRRWGGSLDSLLGLVVPSTPEPSSAVRSDRWFPAGSFNSSSDLHRESVPACGHSLEVNPPYVAGLLALLSRSVRARSVDGGRACRRDRSAG